MSSTTATPARYYPAVMARVAAEASSIPAHHHHHSTDSSSSDTAER